MSPMILRYFWGIHMNDSIYERQEYVRVQVFHLQRSISRPATVCK